jgi:hypothetical protein
VKKNAILDDKDEKSVPPPPPNECCHPRNPLPAFSSSSKADKHLNCACGEKIVILDMKKSTSASPCVAKHTASLLSAHKLRLRREKNKDFR